MIWQTFELVKLIIEGRVLLGAVLVVIVVIFLLLFLFLLQDFRGERCLKEVQIPDQRGHHQVVAEHKSKYEAHEVEGIENATKFGENSKEVKFWACIQGVTEVLQELDFKENIWGFRRIPGLTNASELVKLQILGWVWCYWYTVIVTVLEDGLVLLEFDIGDCLKAVPQCLLHRHVKKAV